VRLDLKPRNIVLRPNGEICVIDFGIIKPATSTDTLMPTPIGTPAYMAPEQVEGKHVDVRTDIYALGVVLYELLTGRTPFQHDDMARLMFAHIMDEPPPPSIFKEMPAGVEAIVLRCLQKAPDDRFQTMADVGDAIRAVLADHGSGRMDLRDLAVGTKRAAREQVADEQTIVESILPAHVADAPQPPRPIETILANAQLRVTHDSSTLGRVFEVPVATATTLRIGRTNDNDIVLPERSVSRQHAVLKTDGRGRTTIEDLNSMNGTMLNSQPVTSARPVMTGDRILIGDCELVFESV
jgi:serine/threonine protein kinase